MSAGGAPAAGTDAGGASGSGPAPRDAAADAEGSDAGAATTMDASVDAGACATRGGTAGTAGFLGDWQPGTYPPDFESGTGGNYLTISGLRNQGGMDRQYAVHVPVGYAKGVPLPALFCLHAFSMNALSFCETMAGWPAKADKETFILIMPNGYQNSWNIGDGCGASLLPALGFTQIDDVGFMRALLEEVGKHVNIDLGRVYAAGFSDGSALAWRLACEASDIFTAVVPVAAGSCLGMCSPTNKVSVLDIYGGADSFNPTEDLALSTAAIRAVSGCSMTTMPAALPKSTGANKCLTTTGCSSTDCSAVEVTECVVDNGSHCWYGDISTADCQPGAADSEFNTTNVAWEFLRRLSR
jgi:polyhydroxybutyrate depolymerase